MNIGLSASSEYAQGNPDDIAELKALAYPQGCWDVFKRDVHLGSLMLNPKIVGRAYNVALEQGVPLQRPLIGDDRQLLSPNQVDLYAFGNFY